MNNFWEQLKWKLYRFMQGRNGRDDLAKAVLYVSLLLYIVGVFLRWDVLCLVGYLLFIYYMFRVLSKNLYARREENRKFVTTVETYRIKFEQRKHYKIFKCKGCGRNIRIPRGKGKIEVTCPMCGKKTIHRT